MKGLGGKGKGGGKGFSEWKGKGGGLNGMQGADWSYNFDACVGTHAEEFCVLELKQGGAMKTAKNNNNMMNDQRQLSKTTNEYKNSLSALSVDDEEETRNLLRDPSDFENTNQAKNTIFEHMSQLLDLSVDVAAKT